MQKGNGEGWNTKVGWNQTSKDHQHLAKELGLYHLSHEETLKGPDGNFIRLCQMVTEYSCWRQGSCQRSL